MLAAFSGLAWEGMWGWHVLYITHPVEVFNAVFGFFTRTPLNLLFPLSFFLLPPVAGAVWRLGRGLGWGRWTVGQRWRRGAWGLGVVLMAGCVARATLFVAITLDQAFEVGEASRDPGIRAFIVEREALRNHFLLLTRAVPAWHTVQVLRAEEAPADEEVRVLAVPHFHVLLGEGREPPTSRYRTIRACPSRLGRYLRYGTFVPWTLARTFPLLAWRRVQTLWAADGR